MARPKQQIDEQIIKEFIVEFQKVVNTSGLIQPIDVHKYALEQYEQGKFPYKLSHDFWKREYRLGRQLIDEYNAIKTTSFSLSDGDSYDLVNVQDLLDKCSDKKELATYLLPMEKQLHRTINDLQKANNTIVELRDEKRILQADLEKERKRTIKMQHLIYQMFTYSTSGATLDNLMNTGTTRTERVSNALQNVFKDPKEFLSGMEAFIKEYDSKPLDNVIQAQFGSNNDENDDWDL